MTSGWGINYHTSHVIQVNDYADVATATDEHRRKLEILLLHIYGKLACRHADTCHNLTKFILKCNLMNKMEKFLLSFTLSETLSGEIFRKMFSRIRRTRTGTKL